MASSSASEAKNVTPDSSVLVKDMIFSSISSLSTIGSKINKSNVKDSIKELKSLLAKMNLSLNEEKTEEISETSGGLPNCVTVLLEGCPHYIYMIDGDLCINSFPIVFKKGYLDVIINTESLSKTDIDYFNRLFYFDTKIMKSMKTPIPIFIFVCHNLLNKSNIKKDIVIKINYKDGVEKVNIGNISSTDLDPYVSYEYADVNCFNMKVWLEKKIIK